MLYEVITDYLIQALEDEIPDIRKVAVEAMASGGGDAWRPLIQTKLSDESKDVRLTVIA